MHRVLRCCIAVSGGAFMEKPNMKTASQQFAPLELETRPTVGTAAAAFYLRKATQTMRIYACKENGPLRPIRIGAHLHWRTDDIRRLLGVA